MPDIFTKAKRSAVMAAIRGRGNKDTELRMMARSLRQAGWTVLRIWEHDLAAKHWPRVAGRIARALAV